MARILVIDDSSFIRAIIKKYLEKNGHEIVGELDDGHNALAMYKELKPDLVTLDIIMPNSGMLALREITTYDANANIVVITGNAHSNTIVEAMKKGAKSFILKPICGDVLLKTISDVLANKVSNEISPTIAEDSSYLCSGKCFLMSMYNESMKDAGIKENDVMIIEKHNEPSNDDLVVAFYDNNIVFGYFYKKANGEIIIKPANINYSVVVRNDVEVLGIIKGIVRIFSKAKICLK